MTTCYAHKDAPAIAISIATRSGFCENCADFIEEAANNSVDNLNRRLARALTHSKREGFPRAWYHEQMPHPRAGLDNWCGIHILIEHRPADGGRTTPKPYVMDAMTCAPSFCGQQWNLIARFATFEAAECAALDQIDAAHTFIALHAGHTDRHR